MKFSMTLTSAYLQSRVLDTSPKSLYNLEDSEMTVLINF